MQPITIGNTIAGRAVSVRFELGHLQLVDNRIIRSQLNLKKSRTSFASRSLKSASVGPNESLRDKILLHAQDVPAFPETDIATPFGYTLHLCSY